MNAFRVAAVLLISVVGASIADETNTPTTASASSNAASSGVTSNAAPTSITIDGTIYEEVRWGRLTPSTVTIFHRTGVATIPLWKLPPDLQRTFGYDQQKVESDQRKAASQARLLNLRRIEGVIYDFSPMVAAFDETVRLEKSEPKPAASWGYSPPGQQWTMDAGSMGRSESSACRLDS